MNETPTSAPESARPIWPQACTAARRGPQACTAHRRGSQTDTAYRRRPPARTAHDRGPRAGSARRNPIRFAAVVLAAALAIAFAAPAALAAPDPVLGAKAFASPVGEGFGTPEPSKIFNGGDPSGLVTQIHWSGWGNPTAIGYGLNPIFKPHGGYYRKPARIELRTTDLGKCGRQRAYTKLEARIPKHPGGKLGKWFPWSGVATICEAPYG